MTLYYFPVEQDCMTSSFIGITFIVLHPYSDCVLGYQNTDDQNVQYRRYLLLSAAANKYLVWSVVFKIPNLPTLPMLHLQTSSLKGLKADFTRFTNFNLEAFSLEMPPTNSSNRAVQSSRHRVVHCHTVSTTVSSTQSVRGPFTTWLTPTCVC